MPKPKKSPSGMKNDDPPKESIFSRVAEEWVFKCWLQTDPSFRTLFSGDEGSSHKSLEQPSQ